MSVIMIVAFMPSMAFATGGNTWDKNGKFKVEIKSGDAHAFAEVYDDYSVLGKVYGEEVNANSVTGTVTMKNVASLGVSEQRSHSVTLNTGLSYKPNLTNFFPHIFGGTPNGQLYGDTTAVEAFKGGTLTGTVNGNKFVYEVSAVTNATEKDDANKDIKVYTMTALPQDVDGVEGTEAVRKAWHTLTSKVTTDIADSKAEDYVKDDSKIEIPAGAYLQIGTKKLLFDTACTVNPSAKAEGGTSKAIRDAAKLYENQESAGKNIVMYIPKDSTLRVGDSIAKLKAGVYIKSDSQAVKEDALTDLRDNKALANMIQTMIKITDGAVAQIGDKGLNLEILTECYITLNDKTKTYVYGDKLEGLDPAKTWVLKGTDTVVTNGYKVTGDMNIVEKTSGGGGGGAVLPVPPTADNVTNNAADKNTTADLTPAVKDNKAETTVDAKTADKIVEKALENKSEEIIVDAAGNNTVASSEVGIPEKTVKEIAEKTDAKLVIKTDNGKVDLDKAAVKAVADQAGTTGTVKLIVETVKNDADICHVNLKLVTSNGAVTDFKGGNVKVTINLTKELAAKELVCVYIDDNGIYTLVEGVLNADGTYTFTTGHFSEYAVMAKAEADKKIAEQLDTMIKDVNLKVRTSKTAKKNIKAVVSGDVKAITDAGYTVKYKFYRSEKKASKYVAKATKAGKTYVNTAGKKGTKYYYKAKALVYDGDKLVGKTVLKQCKYGARTWSK